MLDTPQSVEFMSLNGSAQPLATVSIPQGGVYTSATVSVNFGVGICVTLDPSSGIPQYFFPASSAGNNVTVNLLEPITIGGNGMVLDMDLQIPQSTYFTTCAAAIQSPPSASPFAPVFYLRSLALASQPSNAANGKITGLRGLIESVDSNSANFSVLGAETRSYFITLPAEPPTWQISTNGSTVFQGVASASSLTTGVPVDMDVAIQADGTLVATRVAVYDTDPANLFFSINN
ncbi:MAG: DUF5666 domain-containing protein [Acidobacteriaceae bacterium]|nr:DUF5666 domain-containing protein [Acidobacteriaceae bacterium]